MHWVGRYSLVAAAMLIPQSAQTADPPNIVVIMGDDWSWPHAGALGDSVVKTPNFDRIVREGVLFENAFVVAPSCTPSRFTVLTGQHHWRLGLEDGANLGGSLRKRVPVYPDLLRRSGYATGFCRKGAAPSPHKYRGDDPFGTRYGDFDDFVSQQREGPFCFWYGAGEPHRPYDWQASRKTMSLDRIQVPRCLPVNNTVKTDIGDYYLRVQKLDQLAGKILARLEEIGVLENTIVVMTGDNGMPFPRCKATLYDTGIRVPLAIRWGKRIKPGRRVRDFVSLCDLAPTFLEAAGCSVPQAMTGRSLMTQLTSTQESGWLDRKRNHVLVGLERHVYRTPARAIRTEDFLYVRNFSPASWPAAEGPGPEYDFSTRPWPTKPPAFSFNVDPSPTKQWLLRNAAKRSARRFHQLAFGVRANDELYDLRNDRHQLRNVAADPEYAETRARLARRLSARLQETSDPRFSRRGFATFPVHGWTVHLNESLWIEEPAKTRRMLDLLAEQFWRIVATVPPTAVVSLKKVPVWINPQYKGVRSRAEYHPGRKWLIDNGRNPAMTKCVEITNVNNFEFECTRMPYLMLHELAHAYHDRELGFDHAEIKAVFRAARESGGYDQVRRFTGRRFVTDKAYAMSNDREYFAESTEAYFGKNDFFPFNRDELKKHDPRMHDLLETVWGVLK